VCTVLLTSCFSGINSQTVHCRPTNAFHIIFATEQSAQNICLLGAKGKFQYGPLFIYLLFNIHIATYVTFGQVNSICNYNHVQNINYSITELIECSKTFNTV
jgi:hypothetical protein